MAQPMFIGMIASQIISYKALDIKGAPLYTFGHNAGYGFILHPSLHLHKGAAGVPMPVNDTKSDLG